MTLFLTLVLYHFDLLHQTRSELLSLIWSHRSLYKLFIIFHLLSFPCFILGHHLVNEVLRSYPFNVDTPAIIGDRFQIDEVSQIYARIYIY